jgi:hypothetical protein
MFRAPRHQSDQILYGGAENLWILSMEVASCHPASAMYCLGDMKAFGKFVKPLCYTLQYQLHKNSTAVIICKL